MRNNSLGGCLNWFGLSAGLVIGGGFVYKWLTDPGFAGTVGTVALLLLGVGLGLIAVVAVLINNRLLLGIFRPGANNYKFDVRQPPIPYYPSQAGGNYPQLPSSAVVGLPEMPEMPEMPLQRDWRYDEQDNYPPSA
jgi:hypothetical protein